jgi:hypothetical protein
MTPKRQELVDTMRAALDNGWVRVESYGFVIRWDRWVPFPVHLADKDGRIGNWSPLPEDDGKYVQHVFVKLVTADSNPMLRVCPAPWAGARDSDLTFRRAFEVLADPASALDRS